MYIRGSVGTWKASVYCGAAIEDSNKNDPIINGVPRSRLQVSVLSGDTKISPLVEVVLPVSLIKDMLQHTAENKWAKVRQIFAYSQNQAADKGGRWLLLTVCVPSP